MKKFIFIFAMVVLAASCAETSSTSKSDSTCADSSCTKDSTSTLVDSTGTDSL